MGYLMAQTVNPPGRVCVSADYHPTIYLSANPLDRVLAQTVKPSREGFCASADYHPTIDLSANPADRVFGANCKPSWAKIEPYMY